MLQQIESELRTRLADAPAKGFMSLHHRDGGAVGAGHVDSHGVRFTDVIGRRQFQEEIRGLHQRLGEVSEKLAETFRPPEFSRNESD
mmetsp:Transcript_27352/g.57061  ORF Transcript_27352/g.57061 Transcript_27352/m.57061 type:complete len:87 (-) Transcript_27352:936-1196(-)